MKMNKEDEIVERLSGGEMLMRSLEAEGVEFLFGYPGGAVLHIYDAYFQMGKMQHVLVRHEQAATHMADAYSRATGKPGVVLVTSGPGATNAITGIATAYMDSIPMVVISGQVPSEKIGEDAFQETDMVGVSRPIVKHSYMVKRAEDIPSTIKKAFYLATTGRPGPVVVDIPKDITNPAEKFDFEYPKEIRMRSYTPATKGHSGQIRKAVEILKNAKQPVIYAGGGVVQGNGSELLTELVQKLNAPITTTLMGLGCYPSTDRQWLGMLGMHGTYEANCAMHESDAILAVGARFDDRVTNTLSKFCPNAQVIHIDVDPASISKTIAAHVPIVGDVKSVLADMLQLVEKEKELADLSAWWNKIDGWREAHGLYTSDRFEPSTSDNIKPQDVIKALYEVTKGDAYITSDVGQHQMFAAQYYLFDKPRRWINSGGLGTMGFGLPAALGVKIAFPEAAVACVTGEGSIQMNIQELATSTHYKLPVVIVNLNNKSLGMVKQWQDMQYSSRHAESVAYKDSLPDFVAVMEAYGHEGIKVTKLEDLKPALEKAFSIEGKSVFVDVDVDPLEHVYPMQIAPDGAMNDMYLSKTERS